MKRLKQRTPTRVASACAALAMLTVACSGSLPDWYYGKKANGTSVTLTDGSPSGDSPTTDGSSPQPGQTLPGISPTGGTAGPLPTGTGGPLPTTPPTGSPKLLRSNRSGLRDFRSGVPSLDRSPWPK